MDDQYHLVVETRKRCTHAELKDLDLKVAGRIVKKGLELMELDRAALPGLPKNDPRKALLAHILMERTSVRNKRIVEKLWIGAAPYVSRSALSHLLNRLLSSTLCRSGLKTNTRRWIRSGVQGLESPTVLMMEEKIWIRWRNVRRRPVR